MCVCVCVCVCVVFVIVVTNADVVVIVTPVVVIVVVVVYSALSFRFCHFLYRLPVLALNTLPWKHPPNSSVNTH